jgi:hypothetical protein
MFTKYYKTILLAIIASLLFLGLYATDFYKASQEYLVFGAPTSSVRYERNIDPEIDSEFYLGTTTPSTRAWKGVIADQVCLTGDTCRSTWPSGGGGAFAWTPTNYGVSTSTTLGFLNGFLSTASSTVNASLKVLGQLSASSTATSTFAQGINLDAGCFAIGGTCVGGSGGSGTVTQINTTYPITGGTITTTGTLALAFGTTTANSWEQLQTFTNGINVGGTTFTALIPTSRTITVAGTADQITSSAGAQDLSANRTWTLSLPNHVVFPSSFQAALATTTNATSTNLTVRDNLILEDITSAIALTNATGLVAEYAGTSCTNQFVRALSALGAATCETVQNTDLANSTISGIALGSNLADLTATNSTLTFSGTYNGSTARTIGLNLANANTWTALQQFYGAASSTILSAHWLKVGATASTTIDTAGNVALPAGATLTVPDLTSALTLTGAGGIFAEYAGTSCTNQFVRSLSALGAATCATVGAADVSLANLTATDSTLTFSGTYNGSTARTIGLNLANANIWTALQSFTYGSSTAWSALDAFQVGRTATTTIVGNNATSTFAGGISSTGAGGITSANGVTITGGEILYSASGRGKVTGYFPLHISYASSTFTGTTTILLAPSLDKQTFHSVACETDAGTVGVSLYDGTNRANYIPTASTTINNFLYTTNNSFTPNESRRVQIGTPASSPTKVACTFKYTVDED